MLESLNKIIKAKQMRAISVFAAVLVLVIGVVIALIAQGSGKKSTKKVEDMTGIISESFTEANTESAMISQQSELEILKTNIEKLRRLVKITHFFSIITSQVKIHH